MKTHLSSTAAYRSGFSVIEVLTSIVVAMIGVFGVMVLIPFAVKQAQTGLDSDAATIVARNAYAKFEISGYRNTRNWLTDVLVNADPTVPQVFSIDPLGIMENNQPPALPNYALANFPFNQSHIGSGSFPAPYVIRAANLGTPVGVGMTKADARRMFRAADALVFGEAIDSSVGAADASLNGPSQIYDAGGTVPILKRQSYGDISWSAIVVPVKDGTATASAWKYRMYILVYKDRITDVTDPKGRMLTATLAPITGIASPVSNVYLADSTIDLEAGTFRKDEWVMLINRDPNAQAGFDLQLGFYRVVGYSNNAGPILPSITLDGPDFDFDNVISRRETHIVHLKDVVGVYERTFTPEGASNWNLSY